MLYNKAAVKRPKPMTEKQIKLARSHSPFNLDKESKKELRWQFSSERKGVDKVKNIVTRVSSFLNHDTAHRFNGIRSVEKVWKDKKGHCIERATFLYSMLSLFNIKTSWLITKNAADCINSWNLEDFVEGGIKELAIHPFLIYKNGKRTYRADAVDGEVKPLSRNKFYVVKEDLDFREFVAFWLQDGGEDLGLWHKKYERALDILNVALKIDPNNYTIHHSIGEINYQKKDFEAAKKAHKRAVRMAPNLLDTHKIYGDFLFEVYEEPEFAIRRYGLALESKTNDLEILHSLEIRLNELGEKKLMEKAKKMKEEIVKSKEFKNYFD